MKAFVTGGSGFVGSKLISALISRGWSVNALTRSKSSKEIITTLGAISFPGDILDVDSLVSAMDSCDVAFHCAGLLEIWNKEHEQKLVNVVGTKNVVNACKQADVSRLIHISAAAVISEGKPIRNTDESHPIPLRPFGIYARTKAEAEQIVLSANDNQLTTVALRPPLLWGAGDVHFLPEILKAIKKRQFFWINGGHYPYDTCHVRNLCEAAFLATEADCGGQAYFLTDQNRTSFREFVCQLLETQGVRPGRLSIPRSIAWSSAFLIESIYHLFSVQSTPPITRVMLSLIGGAIEICDDKARRELGYVGHLTREDGLTELRNMYGISASN